MLAILAPSKTLDSETSHRSKHLTTPDFLDDSAQLVDKLKKLSVKKLAELMGVSSKLAELNHARYQQWSIPFDERNACPAIFAFQGDVYEGLDAASFTAANLRFAQQHLRVLSGLYGVLRPLDLMQPYRLEMGTKLSTRRGKDLYAFWGDRITTALNEALDEQGGERVLLNLASQEYFKSVKKKQLEATVVGANFKEKSGNTYKMITFFAKKARGSLAGYMVKNKISRVEELKDFREDGYRFQKSLSSDDQLVFVRG